MGAIGGHEGHGGHGGHTRLGKHSIKIAVSIQNRHNQEKTCSIEGMLVPVGYILVSAFFSWAKPRNNAQKQRSSSYVYLSMHDINRSATRYINLVQVCPDNKPPGCIPLSYIYIYRYIHTYIYDMYIYIYIHIQRRVRIFLHLFI